ncbi:MAG: hypothetical protein WBN42_14095 [Ignavibacteriaceae bacterium]
MKFSYILPIFLLAASLLFLSCSDEPSSLGIELIGSDYIIVRTYDSVNDTINQNSSYQKRVISLGNSDWILVGSYQNVKASSLLKFIFGLADSLKNDVKADNINVLDSWIELRNRYTYVDTLATMNFTVHKVNSPWSSTAFTIDSLSKLQYDMNDVSSDFSISDSTYTFHIDEALSLGWIKNSADNTLENNFGIYLEPTMSANKIIGFQALTPLSSQAAKLTVVIEKPGVYTDTISGFISADISLVDGPVPNLPQGLMCVQSSVSINSKLTFDLGVLPSGVVINKAELFITSDSLNSVKGSSFNNSLRVFYLKNADSTITEGNPISLLFNDNQYTGTITSFVRNWVSRDENFGILIEAGSPTLGLDLFVLRGSDYSEISERPRLRITYTQQKN